MIFSILSASILFASSIKGYPSEDVATMGNIGGTTNEGDVGTMVNNGTIVPPGTYPFMTYVNNCGATLVAPNVLLSAAHCDGDSFGFETSDYNVTGERKVYVGLHDWYNDTRDDGDYESIVIEEKVIHPLYDDWLLDYDYMMVKLKTSSNFTPVVLDDGSLTLNRQSVLTLMGWGRTGYYDNYCDSRDDDYYNDLGYCWPYNLLEADTFYYGRKPCNEFYDVYYEDYYDGRPAGGWVTKRMHCSRDKGPLDGANDVWSGKGDSGGPIIDTVTQKQVGVVSWGGDGDDKSPMVYALVRNQYDWINGWIEDWNLEPKECTDMNNKGPCNEKQRCIWMGPTLTGSCVKKELSKFWTQVGSTIKGRKEDVYAGAAVDISRDGSVIIVGSPYADNPTYGTNTGLARVFKYDPAKEEWMKMGNELKVRPL